MRRTLVSFRVCATWNQSAVPVILECRLHPHVVVVLHVFPVHQHALALMIAAQLHENPHQLHLLGQMTEASVREFSIG
jgi:hypothetical protein